MNENIEIWAKRSKLEPDHHELYRPHVVVTEMCHSDLLLWNPSLLKASVLPLFIHHYVCMVAMLSANDCSSRVLPMENYISRTPHCPDQSFLRKVLKSETTNSPFYFFSLYRCQAFYAHLSQVFYSQNLWCIFSFLGVCFSEDWNEHATVWECIRKIL